MTAPPDYHPGPQLTAGQERALEALLDGASLEAAAAAGGVSTRTLRRWRTEDSIFMSELARARGELRTVIGDAIRGRAVRAVEVLGELADGPAPPATRCTAARALLDLVLALDAEDLAARVAALETRLEVEDKS